MSKFISASEWCEKTHEQNCHACENVDCNDNTSPSVIKMRREIVELRAALVAKGIDPDLLGEAKRLEAKVRALEERNRRMAAAIKRADTVTKDLLRKNEELAMDLSDRANELADLREAVADAVIIIGREKHRLKEVVDSVQAAEALKDGE